MNSKLLIMTMMSIVLLAAMNPVMAQTVHPVASGTDVLKPAIDAAAAGDIIGLISSGGSYLSNDQIVIDKDLTIRARAELAEKPILKYIGTSDGAYMFRIEESAKIVVRGLELDGDGVAEGGAALAKYAFRLDNGDTLATLDLRVYDCVMHDFNEKIIKPYADCGMDSLIVHNSIFYNGTKEGITLYSGSSGDPAVRLKYAEFENCTFYNFEREGIKGDTNPDIVLRVNQCTFYDCGKTSKGMIFVDDLIDVEVKNCIFVKNEYSSYFARFESEDNLVHHINFYDVVSNSFSNTTPTDTLFADPLFADAENGDFTLDAASPARTAGEGGLPAGDLRWAIDPNAVLLSVVTEGNGIVTLDPAGGIYDPGTSVTLTAVPDDGWGFTGWSGITVFPPDQNPTTIVVNENVLVTATFYNLTPQVTLETDVIGLGSVEANPGPGDDGTYDEGDTVELTATPDENWEFVEWLGDLSSIDSPVSFAVDSNMTVTASFQSTLTQFSLNITTEGMGEVSVDPEPVIDTYDTNTVVHVTAEPAQGWQFDGWTGDLVSDALMDSVAMDSDKDITATFSEQAVTNHTLEIDDTWDLRDAVSYANNNSQVDTLLLTTSGGLYTSVSTSDVAVTKPLVIKAQPGLAEKPVLTNSDTGADNDDILRVFDDIMLIGLKFDGGREESHGMKYGVRMSDYSDGDTVRHGANAIFYDCEFTDLYVDKSPTGDGHAYKIDKNIRAGFVHFENCTFKNIGYEAIRVSDTEKWTTDRALDSMVVRNCTFTNIDAECIRYYSDLIASTPDAPVLIEHLTVENSGTRIMYLKNSGGAIVRDIIIANSRTSGHGRDDFLLDAQGNISMSGEDTVLFVPSYVSYIDTFNVLSVPVKASEGHVDEATIFGFDPLFEDAPNNNYTLLGTSPAYGAAHDGTALGDLRWVDPLAAAIEVEEELIPIRYSLEQNYPNPFNPSTTIKFSIKEAGLTTIVVYDVLGREVAKLVNERMQAGTYDVTFENTKIASGVYFYQIRSNDFVATKKMLMIK